MRLTSEQLDAVLRLVNLHVPGCKFCAELATYTVATQPHWSGTPCCTEHIEKAKERESEGRRRRPTFHVRGVLGREHAESLRGVVTQVCVDCERHPCECVEEP